MSATTRCLVVGLLTVPPIAGGAQPDRVISLGFVAFRDAPSLPPGIDLVIAPLYRPDFDALEVIDQLGARGYRGRLRVLAKGLPNRALVLRELRAHGTRRGIEVDLVDED